MGTATRHNENGVFCCPRLLRLVGQVEGCCNISRVTGAGTGLCASLKWNRKIRDFLVPTGNGMVRGDLAQATQFTDEKETTRGSQRGKS